MMDEPKQPDAEVIEGFYDWGPGVVVTADCLGQSYQTSLAGRPLIVKMPVFDGEKIVEPPLRYKRPDSYVDVDPPNGWGELRSWNTAADGSPIPVTVCIKRVRLWFPVTPAEAANQFLGPQLDNALSPWWGALSSWIEVATGQDLAILGDRRPKKPQTFHLWGGNAGRDDAAACDDVPRHRFSAVALSAIARFTGNFGRCRQRAGRSAGTASLG